MKKLILILFIAISFNCISQTLQLSNVNRSIPRISWSIGKTDTLQKNVYGSILLMNQGTIWKTDTSKLKYRTIMLAPVLTYGIGIIHVGGGVGLNLNTKEKTFINDHKSKSSYWFDNRVLNPFIVSNIAITKEVYLCGYYFLFKNKMNQRMFNIGLAYNF